MVECKYRGRVIGYLKSCPDGFLRYVTYDEQERLRSDWTVERIRKLWQEYYDGF